MEEWQWIREQKDATGMMKSEMQVEDPVPFASNEVQPWTSKGSGHGWQSQSRDYLQPCSGHCRQPSEMLSQKDAKLAANQRGD